MISAWREIDANDAEQQVKNLRARITSVELEIESFRVFGDMTKTSYGHQLAFESLRHRRGALLAELGEILALRERELIKISLSGRPFDGHSASFGTLASFLRSTQKLFTSVTQAITTGPTERGPVPGYISRSSELRLVEVFPSSFGMIVELGRDVDPNGQQILERSLKSMFSLLDSSPQGDQLLERVGGLGIRTMNHYRHLVKDLRNTATTPALVWADAAGNANSWQPSADRLEDISRSLESIRAQRSETLTATGLLVGASLLRGKFELLTDSGDVLQGAVAADAYHKLSNAFAARCVVRYTRNETINRLTGASRIAITLTDVTPADEQDTPTGLAPISG